MDSEDDQLDQVTNLISQFPRPLRLVVDKKWKATQMLFMGLFILLFSIQGIFLTKNWLDFALGVFMGVFSVIFLVFAVLTGTVKDNYLLIDKHGFTKKFWFSSKFYAWRCVDKFTVMANLYGSWPIPRDWTDTGVSFRWRDESKGDQGSGREVTRTISTLYGLSASELMRLLVEWRKRALEKVETDPRL